MVRFSYVCSGQAHPSLFLIHSYMQCYALVTWNARSMVVGCALFAMGLNDGNLQPYDRSFMENLWPKYEPDPFTGVVPDFFRCLALVYPCVTGILAGMSRSHVLKSPAQSIPTGTLWAIITCTAVYLVVCWLFGMVISNRTLKVDKFVTASVAFPHGVLVQRIGDHSLFLIFSHGTSFHYLPMVRSQS